MMTHDTTLFENYAHSVRDGRDLAEVTEELLAALTPEEKLALLDGDTEFWTGMQEMVERYNGRPLVMGEIARVGIPGLRFSDGPRGAVVGNSTAFPVAMARGATWDVALEVSIGEAIGAEIRAQGANFFGGVCINLPRHPAWGRVQETYGEDSFLLGEFGSALTRGVRRHAMAVAKHYALNSMENARFTVDVSADDQTLQEVYLPHFRRVVEEGVDGIMTAYNKVNGGWAGENETLMEGILRDQWGFTGVTVSDFIFGIRDAAKSLRAGLDVEEPFRQQRAEHLASDLEAGRASWSDVDRAARRILSTQLAFAARDLAAKPGVDIVFSAEHRALARKAASSAVVLLKNDAVGGSAVLPLRREALERVAVIGRLADLSNTGDKGSSNVFSPDVSTPLQGIRTALPEAMIEHVENDDAGAAAAAAREADVAIVIVGYTAADEGEFLGGTTEDPELLAVFPPLPAGADPQALVGTSNDEDILMGGAIGGDRESLRLRPADVEIIQSVAAANPRTVVVIVTAGAVITEEWRESVPAVLISWYNGSEGGHGLADVLFGIHDATGRLPYSIPSDESHLPYFDRNATTITYDRWHGQRLLDRDGVTAAFPLGFGLSYTSFEISEVSAGPVNLEQFEATVTVRNTGTREGRHIVQLYAVLDAEDFPQRVLVGFAPIKLAAGTTGTVVLTGSTRPTNRWTSTGFTPAAETAVLEASSYSGDPRSASTSLRLA
jgi:beta-glucosidase